MLHLLYSQTDFFASSKLRFRNARYNASRGSDRVGTDVMHHVMLNICDALCDAKQYKYHDAFMVHNMVHSIIHNRMMHK